MKTCSKGFSLLELLITLSIASLLLLLAIPAWKNIREQQEINALTRRLQATFTYARNQAILRHEVILITPQNNNWKNGWRVITEKHQQTLQVFTPPPNHLQLQLIVLRKNNQIKIMPDGTTNGSNGHFSYSKTNLIFNRGGRLHTEHKP
jgi:type IV fimbrial biogenesis protein FimT